MLPLLPWLLDITGPDARLLRLGAIDCGVDHLTLAISKGENDTRRRKPDRDVLPRDSAARQVRLWRPRLPSAELKAICHAPPSSSVMRFMAL